jgi:hypothetical protein
LGLEARLTSFPARWVDESVIRGQLRLLQTLDGEQ